MDRHRPALTKLALAAAPLAFLALFFVLPLEAILRRALADGFPLHTLLDGTTLRLLWFTTWQAALSTVLTLLAAAPVTWALSRFRFPGRDLVDGLVALPFVLPTVVVATAFLLVLPDRLERSLPAILLAHVFFNVAVVTRIVGPAWRNLDTRFAEVAATLGTPPARRLTRVTLPLLAPSAAAAAAIVFVFCFTSFGVVVLLGGPRRSTLEVEIYNQAVRQFDLRTGAALALLQLAAVASAALAATTLERRLARRTGVAPPALPLPAGRERLAVALVVAVTLLALATPPAVLVTRSFTIDGAGGYARIFEETPALLVAPWHGAVNSVLFAGAATLVALAVALPAAVLTAGGSRLVDVALMLPLGASAAMLGFGFLLAFDEPPLALRGSVWLVPLAQALVAAPFVLRAMVPPLRAIDPRLREVAATLGLPGRGVLRRVELPLLRPALALATGLAFAIALGEFGATVFVARADRPTLPVAIFRLLGRPGAENVATATSLAVVLALVTVGAVTASRLAAGSRR